MTDAERLWKVCSEVLRGQVSDATWKTWFEAMVPVSLDELGVTVAVPSTLVRERVESRYLQLVEHALAEAMGCHMELRLEVRTDRADGALTGSDRPAGAPPGATVAASTDHDHHDDNHNHNHNHNQPAPVGAGSLAAEPWARPARGDAPASTSRFTFEAFVIGESNRFAHAASRRVAEEPGSYNPLFIQGKAGLGKTHLLHAIRNYVDEHFPNHHARYVPAETFLNEFVDAIRNNTAAGFKKKYRECDVLLVDDIQFMEGKERSKEEFFHTFNHLHGAGSQIVLTSDRPPQSIGGMEDRIRSRFLSGLVVDIQPPELETRLAILGKKAEAERQPVPEDVLEFIATHVKTNIRELEGALTRVTAKASLDHQTLTLRLAEQVLSDILADNQPGHITTEAILEATAQNFGFTVEELCGPSRRRPLVIARQVGMYVTRELTDYSYPAIARVYGGRDHTTVIHAVDKIANLMKERRPIYVQVEALIKRIRTGA